MCLDCLQMRSHPRNEESQSLLSNYKNHVHLGFLIYPQRVRRSKERAESRRRNQALPGRKAKKRVLVTSSEEEPRVDFGSGREGT